MNGPDMTRNDLYGIWGSSSSNIYAVGNSGNSIIHYDGSQWTIDTSFTTAYIFYSIWGTSSSDVFVAGNDPNRSSLVVLHYDGTSWNVTNTTGLPNDTPMGIWGVHLTIYL